MPWTVAQRDASSTASTATTAPVAPPGTGPLAHTDSYTSIAIQLVSNCISSAECGMNILEPFSRITQYAYLTYIMQVRTRRIAVFSSIVVG